MFRTSPQQNFTWHIIAVGTCLLDSSSSVTEKKRNLKLSHECQVIDRTVKRGFVNEVLTLLTNNYIKKKKMISSYF